MALSNWDTLAFSLNGPCSGTVANEGGWQLEIYKNWLNVRQGEAFVAMIEEGSLSMGGWQIRARRGPQSGVYLVAWTVEGGPTKALLVGCGVYGFVDPIEEHANLISQLGAEPVNVSTVYDDGADHGRLVAFMPDGSEIPLVEHYSGAEFIGVKPSSAEFLRSMANEVFEENSFFGDHYWPAPELAAIDWDHALRANQGDLYFQSHTGTDFGTTTPPGDAETPMLLQMLQSDTDTED